MTVRLFARTHRSCASMHDVLLELCDGVDNDCDAGTVDGTDDPDVIIFVMERTSTLVTKASRSVNGDIVCSDPNTLNRSYAMASITIATHRPRWPNEATLIKHDGEDVDGCLEAQLCVLRQPKVTTPTHSMQKSAMGSTTIATRNSRRIR